MLLALGYGNLVGSATVSGGSWLAGAPVTNVATWATADCARSSNDDAASTVIRMDHGSAVSVGAVVLMGHNLSSAATVQLKRGTSAGGTQVSDTGAVNAWQFTPRSYDGQAYPIMIVRPTDESARYTEIAISDTSNPDGYVEVGRVMICPTIRPTYDQSYGLRDNHTDHSLVGKAHSGAAWVTAQKRLRTVSFVLPYLSLEEGDALHQMEQVEGLTGEVAYLPYTHDKARMQQYGFVGLMRELTGLEYPFYRARTKAFNIEQRG